MTNVTGVTRAEHVFAIEVAAHVVLVSRHIETEAALELALLGSVRIQVHRVCQRDQVRYMKNNLFTESNIRSDSTSDTHVGVALKVVWY